MKQRFKRFASAVLCICVALNTAALSAAALEENSFVTLPPTASADDPNASREEVIYLALGDSITAGVGLYGTNYLPAEIGVDMSPNFSGYSSDCYAAKAGAMMGLDRSQIINFGLPGLTTKDMLDMVTAGAMPAMNQESGFYYQYPQLLDYIEQADIISIQIGANDAMVPFIVSIGEATHWKTQLLTDALLSTQFRYMDSQHFDLLYAGLLRLNFTAGEWRDLIYALTDGLKECCSRSYDQIAEYLPQIIKTIRQRNPSAQILLLGYNDPVPLSITWASHFYKLNRLAKEIAAEENITYVSIPFTECAADAHPTQDGHDYIARQIIKALS